MKNSDKRIIKSFVVGDNIRFFNTDEKLYKCVSLSNKEYLSINNLNNENMNFHYFMKDKKHIKFEYSYSKKFIDFLNKSISENSKQYNDVYYNFDNIKFNNIKHIIQYNNKCYFLDKIKYDSEIPYTLKQKNYEIDNKDVIFNYISKTYDKNYFNDSHIVNNKSIPIYDVNKNNLENISFVKTKKPEYIMKLLKDYNLSNLSSVVLFNSKEFKLNSENYDSLFVKNLINEFSKIENFNYEKFFKSLFSLAEKESFYRILNPIGLINTLKNNKKSNYENEYLYSIDLSNEITNFDIPINYFSLKNLKSPEGYHDYFFVKTDNNSIKSSSYDFENNIISELFSKYNKLILNEFNNFLDENNVVKYSGKIIKSKNIINDLIEIFLKRYPKYNRLNIERQFNILNDGNNHLDNKYMEFVYKIYILKKFNVDIRFNPYIVSYEALIKKINFIFSKFFYDSIIYIIKDFNIKYEGKYKITIKNGETESKKINNVLNLFYNFYNEFLNFINSCDLYKNDCLKFDFILKIKNILQFCNINGFTDKNYIFDECLKLKIFESGIYLNNVKNILNEIEKIDSYNYSKFVNNEKNDDKNEFKIRMSEKKSNYLNLYNDMHNKENQFKLSGVLYGSRIYDSCFKTHTNDFCISYNYDTIFDENFLNDEKTIYNNDIHKYVNVEFNNIINFKNSINENIYIFDIKNLIHTLNNIFNVPLYHYKMKNEKIDYTIENNRNNYFRELFNDNNNGIYIKYMIHINDFKWEDSEYNLLKVYFILNDNFILTFENSKIDNYFKMLNIIKKYQFIDKIKGEHYYKDYEKTKSNIISLNIKNSGLTYNVYSFLEVVNIICKYNDLKFDQEKNIFIDQQNGNYKAYEIFKLSNFYKIYETEKIYYNELSEYSDSDDLYSFKYFKSKKNDVNKIRKLIKSKIHIRNTFEDSIRNSSNRYIPINTTLWKIEYSGITDNEYYNTNVTDITLKNDSEIIPKPNYFPSFNNVGSLNNPYIWYDWITDETKKHIKVRILESEFYNNENFKHYISCVKVYLEKDKHYLFGCTSEEHDDTIMYIFDKNKNLITFNDSFSFFIDGIDSINYPGAAGINFVPLKSDYYIIAGGFKKGWVYFSIDFHCNEIPINMDDINYLTFTAEEQNSTVKLNKVNTPDAIELEYTINDSGWNIYSWSDSEGEKITLTNVGDIIRFRASEKGNYSFGNNIDSYHKFIMTGKIAASGSINTLLDKTNKITDLTGRYHCFKYLFDGCISLTSLPKLNATKLTDYCYFNMFRNCSNIKLAPEMKIEKLAPYCCLGMFNGCVNLTNTPNLSTKKLELACYHSMFWNCAKLSTACELPAETLTNYCYLGMFKGCSSLTKISVKFTDWKEELNATTNWVNNVSKTGTFICPPGLNTEKNENKIPENWTIINN